MIKKILKIFTMGILCLLLCIQIFNLLYLVDWVGTRFGLNQDTSFIICFLFSAIAMLVALIKNKNIKIFLLGFWPILSVLFLVLLGINLNTFFVSPEILLVFLLYIGFLLQLFILNKKAGCIGSIIFLLLISLYIYIHPAYICERENGLIKCGGNSWNWDKKICESKFNSCGGIINIEEIK